MHYPLDWTLEQFQEALTKSDPAAAILKKYIPEDQHDNSDRAHYRVSLTTEYDQDQEDQRYWELLEQHQVNGDHRILELLDILDEGERDVQLNAREQALEDELHALRIVKNSLEQKKSLAAGLKVRKNHRDDLVAAISSLEHQFPLLFKELTRVQSLKTVYRPQLPICK